MSNTSRVTKNQLESLLSSYAEAPVRYPKTVERRLAAYIKKQHQQAEKLDSFVDMWYLFLETQMKIFCHILNKNGITGSIKYGRLVWRSYTGNFPHPLIYWQEVGDYWVDYRARSWYTITCTANPELNPIMEQIPFGVFVPDDYPHVSYTVQTEYGMKFPKFQ